ncbi:MAG TPA: peptidase U32 family protein, partial [Candidatus Brocadiia bacterium]|nr:peptidase U32 family protein [Candidatus Brocadiia bacterium]
MPAPELLAPVGDWDALRAAVLNGADAVYFGLSRFSARQRAVNFTLDELPQVMRYLRDHNARGYVAFNTLLFSSELPQAQDMLRGVALAGADAVIVQDLGVARLVRRLAPGLPVHASTQMSLTDGLGLRLAEDLGVTRAILARELSLGQIRRVASQTRLELEVFVHGALCVSYSGQCLASLSLGGRSANRGECAQPCRLPWELAVDGQVRDLQGRRFLLSPRDLSALADVPALIQAGVAGLKIEGRLKSALYAAAVTRAYRLAIDAAAQNLPFRLPPDVEEDLA